MGFGKGRPRITNKDDLIQATIRRTKSHTWTAEIMSKYPITNKWHLFAKEVKDTPGKIKIVNNEDPLTSSITIMDGVRADTGPYRYLHSSKFNRLSYPNAHIQRIFICLCCFFRRAVICNLDIVLLNKDF